MKIALVGFFKRMKYSFRKSGKSKKKKNGKNKKTGKDGRPRKEEGMEGLAWKRRWKVCRLLPWPGEGLIFSLVFPNVSYDKTDRNECRRE